jgi:60 kDa SS-A/Ro ribonucleoprotein
MTTKYADHLTNTPQTHPITGREADMIKNCAGGFTFQVSPLERVRRFLILGSEGGTYYAGEREMTRENAQAIVSAVDANPEAVVNAIVDVSDRGLAPKNDPAIFALALASVSANPRARQLAFGALPKVCRIPTHLFNFVDYRQKLGGGWGRGLKRAVRAWYLDRSPQAVAINALKYQSRNGWSNRDLLRLAHPKAKDALHAAVFDAICEPEAGKDRFGPKAKDGEPPVRGKSLGWDALRANPVVDGWLKLRDGETEPAKAVAIIREARLQREMLPTELLTQMSVWDALLPNLGYTALIRNLGNLSKCGLLVPHSDAARFVRDQLGNGEMLRKSRVHPFSVLLALNTYSAGKGFKGSGTWAPVSTVVDALNDAFYEAFHNVAPTGQRFMLGLDVSASMKSSRVESSNITAAQAAAAMAMVTARTEKDYEIVGFDHGLKDLKITARDSLADVQRKTGIDNGGGTDCALPIKACLDRKLKVDAVLVYTDNETWAGPAHAQPVLQQYRKTMGIPMKLGMVAFTSTANTVADPTDAGSMNFVGLDASLPQAIAAFVNG